MPLRHLVSEWGIPAGLACMVVAFAAGSGSETWVKQAGLHVRWIVLVLLSATVAVAAARRFWLTRTSPSRGLLRFSALAGSFLALAVVSLAWSPAPRLTFDRAGSLGILFVLGAGLASLTATDVTARLRLFQGLAVGAIAVGVLGLFVVALDYNTAVQQAGASNPWRYRGFTENPNTIGILAAATLPILTALTIRSAGRRRQGWIAGGLLMLLSLVASGSRGGLLGACAGTLLVAGLGVQGFRQRSVALASVALVFGAGIASREVAQPPAPAFSSQVAPALRPVVAPAPQAPVAAPAKARTPKPTGHGKTTGQRPSETHPKTRSTSPGKAPKHTSHPVKPKVPPPLLVLHTKTQRLPTEDYEIGFPTLSKTATSTAASGRIAAWKGALELIGDRPILGYGFGTEQKVFFDRWYFFQGGTTENSYLGLLLELGIVGLVLVAAMGGGLLIGGLRALRFLDGDERVVLVAGLGVLLAAAAIMLIQSYLYSVGNIVTTTVWISLFAVAPIAMESRSRAVRIPTTAPEVVS